MEQSRQRARNRSRNTAYSLGPPGPAWGGPRCSTGPDGPWARAPRLRGMWLGFLSGKPCIEAGAHKGDPNFTWPCPVRFSDGHNWGRIFSRAENVECDCLLVTC